MAVYDLEELADRCEREEASTLLDRAISAAMSGAELPAFPYTSSVDAAKRLEPDDAQEVCVRMYPVGAYVRITLASGKPVYSERFGQPITEARARCAAGLRARARS